MIFTNNTRAQGGGLKWAQEEELKKQRGVAWDVVKQVGTALWEGKDLVTVTLPVYLFEPRSFIERLADGFSFAPIYLKQAAEAVDDPLERFKKVITFYIAGIHLTSTQRKPFNPILGETYQGRFLEDGTEVFCEQTTHHPPASNFQVIPKDGSYLFWGYGIFSAIYMGNIVKGVQTGPNFVDFPDKTRITISLPHLVFRGLMWGDRIQDLGGTLKFEDEKHNLSCELVLNPEAPGWVASWFTTPKYTTDYLMGDIIDSESLEKLSHVEGCWLSHIDFDGERYWNLEDTAPCCLAPVDDPLPSDCRYRYDLQALLAGNAEEAQRRKTHLEEKQRYEAKLRKEGKEILKEHGGKRPKEDTEH